MKTIEAIIAFVFFIMILQLFTPLSKNIDTSLYHVQIANDIWRVFQLRSDLQGFDKNKLNIDANRITELTKLCIEFQEEDVTSCIPKEKTAQLERVAIIDGKATKITLKIGTGE